MKLAIVLLLGAPLAALCASSSSEFLAELKAHPDGNAAMGTLQHLMAAAQQKLSLVERHHGKIVKKVRKQADAFLQEEAAAYGGALNSYSAELLKAEADMQEEVAVAKAGLKVSEAAPVPKTNDWKDPSVMERAKLNAQVAATERAVKHVERQRVSEVREGVERSEEQLESEAQKLGMKLGDMTPLVDTAKKTLEAQANKVQVAPKVVTPVASKTVNLPALQDALAKALPKERTAAASAQKKLDGFLSKADKELASKRTVIEQGLLDEQKAEITKVLGAAPSIKQPVKLAVKPAKAKVAAPAKVAAAPAKKAVVAAPAKK